LAAWFLWSRFESLLKAGIEVVWAGCSRADLPEWMAIPAGVRFLPDRHSIGFRLSGSRTVEIEWANLSGDQQTAGQTGDIRIQLHRGDDGLHVEYAVRGRTQAARHPAGHPAGREGNNDQPACWLSDWSPTSDPVTQFVETAAVRRIAETVAVDSLSTWSTLRARMRAQMESHARTAGAELVIVDWTLTGTGRLWNELSPPEGALRLQEELRNPRVVGPAAVVVGQVALRPAEEQWRAWETDETVRTGLTEGRTLIEEIRQGRMQLAGLPSLRTGIDLRPHGAWERALVHCLSSRPEAA